MLGYYSLSALTGDGEHIRGNVVLEPPTDSGGDQGEETTAGGDGPAARRHANADDLEFKVAACQIFHGYNHISACEDAGFLRFRIGPAPSLVNTREADWRLGLWTNDGTGVWFLNDDGSQYLGETEDHGLLTLYRQLPPRIKLNADNVEQGPFFASGDIWLSQR